MPPEAPTRAAPESPAARAREACARWAELAALYDALDACATAAAWDEAAALVPRLRALEGALRPLIEARRAVVGAAEVAAWAPVDALVRRVAARHAPVLEAASAARDGARAALARAGRTRADAARYRRTSRAAPLFASRMA